MSKVNRIYENSVFSVIILKNLIILNFRTIIHVFNDLSWFSNFRKASHEEYIIVRNSHVFILEYDNITLWLKKNDQFLKLKDVIYCINFAVNFVSFSHFMNKNIHWNIIKNFLFQESDSSVMIIIKIIACQLMIKKMNESSTTLVIKK